MHNHSMRMVACLLLLCVGLACMAGCLNRDGGSVSPDDISVIPAGTNDPDYAGTYQEGPLRITVPEFIQYWSADDTCYWEGRIQVENTGVKTGTDVIIRSSLIDLESGNTVDTDTKNFQRIGGGDTLTFVVQLHGACDGRYTIRVETFAN